jgi:hypothetical protein
MKVKATVFLLVMIGTGSFAQTNDRILGIWQDSKWPEKRVLLYKQNEKYFGKYPNEEKLVFKNLVWETNKKTYKGILINPVDQEEFEVVITFLDNNTFRFKVNKFIFSRTFVFSRVK